MPDTTLRKLERNIEEWTDVIVDYLRKTSFEELWEKRTRETGHSPILSGCYNKLVIIDGVPKRIMLFSPPELTPIRDKLVYAYEWIYHKFLYKIL